MSLLKRQNWFVCLILNIITFGFFNFLIGYMLEVYDKNAWYYKWQYWVFGLICLIFPAFLMIYVFIIQTIVNVAVKLKIPGSEIYTLPYAWILCLIVPVLGWILLITMLIYLNIWIIVMLYKGEGEKYIKR